jgi:hypothetical protein
VFQLGNKVLDIIDVRCNHEIFMLIAVFFILDVSDCGIMGYDMVDVVICEQSDASETPLITYQSTWGHPPDHNSLNHFRED